MDDAPKFNGFEILETLPRGGMSTVYKARQISLERIVALKTLPPSLARDTADIDKFIFEARITASLKHPNIVQVYDFGQSDEGIYYFVMEFISGYSVAHWIRRKQRITQDNALLIAQSVAEALKYAWEHERIIHCDVKPDNIIIDSDGSIKVADLGLAKSIRSVADKSETDVVFGTPNYIAPEQARGDANLDCRTDIYATGATIYHCLTGRMPFDDLPPLEVMDRQITDTIADPQEIHPDISTGAACLVEKMMHKEPADRPVDWAAVISDIIQVRSEKLPEGDFRQVKSSTVRRCAVRQQHLQDIYRLLDHQETRRTDGLPEKRYLQGFWLAETPQPRPRVAKPTGAIPRIARRKLSVEKIAAIGLGLTALLLVLLIMRHFRKPVVPYLDERVAPAATASEPAVAATESSPSAQPDERERLARELFDATLQWRVENPGQYDQGMLKFDQVATDTRGTRYAALAMEESQKLRQAKNRAINRVVHNLREQAEQLGARNRFSEAAAIFAGYTGELAKETAKQRQAQVTEWQGRADKLQADLAATKKTREARWQKALRATAEHVLQETFTPALTQIQAALNDASLKLRQDELRELESLCQAAAGLDQRLLASFQEQRDQTVEVRLIRSTEKLTIRDVVNDVVIAEKITPLGAGYASIPMEFRLTDLAAREKQDRLGAPDTPEKALLQALLAMRDKNYEAAERAFEAMDNPLGRELYAGVQRLNRASREQDARAEFLHMLARVAIVPPSPIPPPAQLAATIKAREFSALERQTLAQAATALQVQYAETDYVKQYAPVLDELRAGAVLTAPPDALPGAGHGENHVALLKSQLLLHNPGLQESEINCQTDQQGQPVRLEIISPALRSLQPLARSTSLHELICGGKSPADRTGAIILAPLDNLEPLRHLPLQALYLGYTRVRDITPLAGGMPALRRLSLTQTEVTDLAPLAGMNLTALDVSFTRIKDLAPLRDMPLKELNITQTEITDLHALRGCPLESVLAGRTRIRDLSPLTGMLLNTLDVRGTDIRDLAPLNNMPLERLFLAGAKVKDLTQIHGMPLKQLDLSNTEIKNILPLRGMPLRVLHIGQTGIRDITPLQAAPIEELWLDYQPFQQRRDTDRVFGEILRQMPALVNVNGSPWRQNRGQSHWD